MHKPVMLDETVSGLNLSEGAIAVDCTAGGGGHLAKIAQAVGPNGRVIAMDRDLRAHQEDAAAGVAKQFSQIKLFHASFSKVTDILAKEGIKQIDGLLCDLGVSSAQLDEADRGFSLMRDGPIDMRMDQTKGETVYEFLGRATEGELADIIYQYGEEPKSRRIARAIVSNWPIADSTLALAELISKAAGGRRSGIHPATKTFQALRIFINRELDELDRLLEVLPQILAVGGRAAFISFHSLEDRKIKIAFKNGPFKRISKKPITATEEELQDNKRARSAKLRVVERLPNEGGKE